MSDVITTICIIVLCACGFGMFWAGYLWYTAWLWDLDMQSRRKRVYRPVEPITDVSYTEIARYD